MDIPKERKRGVSLSEQGKITVRKAKCLKGWSQEKWAENISYLSISTIKRFLKGKKIDRANFKVLCTALDLEPNDLISYSDDQLDSATSPISPVVASPFVPPYPERSPTQHSGTSPQSFMITGTFSPNKLGEIEVALAHLEKLLRDSATFTLVPERNYLAVSGTFSENKKPQVEVALVHLEKLLLEHSITPEWME